MKGYGSGIIRCACSVTMAKGKNVSVYGSTPQRKRCPNCGRMLRVRLVTKVANRTPGTTAEKKRKRQDKVTGHVAVLEAENRELRTKVKELEKIIVQAKACVKEMQEEMTHRSERKHVKREKKE